MALTATHALCRLPPDTQAWAGPYAWWHAVDGSGALAYVLGACPDNRWDPLVQLTSLPGASHREQARYHYVVETDIPAHAEADFNAWYDTEHLPGLAHVPGTVHAYRYRRIQQHPQYVACYDLVTPAAMESPEWLSVRGTPWSDRVRPLFHNTRRTLYTRLST